MSGPSAPADDAQAAGFDSLPLPAAQLQNLQDMGYALMTPVQALSLPPALQGRDLIAQAKTGSGKTAAFADPAAPLRQPGTRREGHLPRPHPFAHP